MGFAVPGNAAMDKRSGSVRRAHSGVMVEGKPEADGTRTLLAPASPPRCLCTPLMVFTPVSAVRPRLERAVVDERDAGGAGFVSTTMHFLVVASFTTENSAATALPPIAGATKATVPIIRT